MLGKLGNLAFNLFTLLSTLKLVFLKLCSIGPFGRPHPGWNLINVAHCLNGGLSYQNCAFIDRFPSVGLLGLSHVKLQS